MSARDEHPKRRPTPALRHDDRGRQPCVGSPAAAPLTDLISRPSEPSRRIVLAGSCGNVIIAIAALVIALCLLGRDHDDIPLPPPVTWATIVFGLAYTIASEAMHLSLGIWHYSSLMPRLPALGVGLAPTLRWLVIPIPALRAGGASFAASMPRTALPRVTARAHRLTTTARESTTGPVQPAASTPQIRIAP